MSAITPIDLPQARAGFYNFFSSWLYQLNGKSILVDCGPASSVPFLINSVVSRGCSRIDYLLLTHIHLDHAGGAGQLIANYPVDKGFCHEKAIVHLVDPARMWQGSLKTLGDLATLQGQPIPVPEGFFRSDSRIVDDNFEIKVFPSPGHAAHHISFLIEETLFIGEALGVIFPDMPNYQRPATPVRFFEDEYKNSIKSLADVQCKTLCYGHFGSLERRDELFERSLNQIDLWIDAITSEMLGKGLSENQMLEKLTECDPLFSKYLQLSPALQERESHFVKNSIRGIYEFLTGR